MNTRMSGESQTAARRIRLTVLAAALVIAALPAAAQAVVLSPTHFPLTGSNFQGGDGNQATPTAPADASNPAPFPTTIDWQALAANPGLETLNDPTGAADNIIDGKENEPVNWDVKTGAATPAKSDLLASWSFVDDDADGPFL